MSEKITVIVHDDKVQEVMKKLSKLFRQDRVSFYLNSATQEEAK